MIGEDTVAIVKQVFIPALRSNCLTQLLQRPGGTRMGGDIAMDQSAAAVLDHHKHVQESESRSDGDEEITRNDPLRVQARKVDQPMSRLGRRVGRFGRYLLTVRGEI